MRQAVRRPSKRVLEAERLACLRMMMDQGVQDADYPDADDGKDERARVFERLLGL